MADPGRPNWRSETAIRDRRPRSICGPTARRRGAGHRQRPTALFRLLELVDDGAPRARRVAGRARRVRRLGAVEAGADRPTTRHGIPGGQGRRGGSAMAAAAVNAIASEQGMSRGKLWGVGLGPGDPELVTVKAARVIAEADIVAYHSARHGHSIARGIAEPYLRPGRSRSTWSIRSPPRPPIIRAATRARWTTSTASRPSGSPRI